MKIYPMCYISWKTNTCNLKTEHKNFFTFLLAFIIIIIIIIRITSNSCSSSNSNSCSSSSISQVFVQHYKLVQREVECTSSPWTRRQCLSQSRRSRTLCCGGSDQSALALRSERTLRVGAAAAWMRRAAVYRNKETVATSPRTHVTAPE